MTCFTMLSRLEFGKCNERRISSGLILLRMKVRFDVVILRVNVLFKNVLLSTFQEFTQFLSLQISLVLHTFFITPVKQIL